ncbi:hypothetical protein DL546_000162 [Coniochaeta pulveracea]|uniref:Uncharacterized protein n=1 Tax=Coniochaeta pulveracea TaxID=177199 RepID=A0A420YIK5_9PEZI|nr:hypothetical protein DL546_000162 [Coniochaeta pulveracea]
MSLVTILEEYMEESGLQNQNLGKFIDQASGDVDLEPGIEIDGNGEDGAHAANPVDSNLPDINIGNPVHEPVPAINANPAMNDMPPQVVQALLTLQGAINTVDQTVAEVGSDIYQADNWWPAERKLILNQQYANARLRIQEFLQPLDVNVPAQEKMIKALKGLEKLLK